MFEKFQGDFSRPARMSSAKDNLYFTNRQKQRMEKSIKPIWARSPIEPEALPESPEPIKQELAPIGKLGKNALISEDSSSSMDDASHPPTKKVKKSKKPKKSKKSRRASSTEEDSEEEYVMMDKSQVDHILAMALLDDDRPVSAITTTDSAMDVAPREGSDDEEFGPSLPRQNAVNINEKLDKEGLAMKAFLESGKRIPRRGEIGLTSDEISKHESAGFVMSGSRHVLMNAVRVKKENQVISVEERKALLLFNQSEKIRKEAEIIANFKELVAQRIAEANSKADGEF